MSSLDQRLQAELAQLRARSLYRTRREVRGRHGVEIEVDGKPCLNFCSNDYLGMAGEPRVAKAAQKALGESGTGSGAAALISGYNSEHRHLEEALAEFVQRPRALLFSSGWAANLGVLKALLGKNDTLIADELNHASLIDGGRLSGARYVRVGHCDLAAYARTLENVSKPFPPAEPAPDSIRGGGEVILATDAVFSMDGDLAPLPELAVLCKAHGAALMVDDAHGFGVLGEGGRGSLFAPHSSPLTPHEVPIYMATLGKSLGVAGAFVAGSEALIEFLIQRARSWVFSTASPPALSAAARESLRIVQAEPERRQALHERVQQFRAGAEQLGIALTASETAIQPLILGEERRALDLSARLYQRGYWVAAIRPPTVPAGTARLRITFSASHSEAQVDDLLEALAKELKRMPILESAA